MLFLLVIVEHQVKVYVYILNLFLYSFNTVILKTTMQDSSSKCFGSSKTSRICLVDLAGFERNVADNASRQHMKEGKYIKKSISQLGYASPFELGSDLCLVLYQVNAFSLSIVHSYEVF